MASSSFSLSQCFTSLLRVHLRFFWALSSDVGRILAQHWKRGGSWGTISGSAPVQEEHQRPMCWCSAEEAPVLCRANLRAVQSLEEGKHLHVENSISKMFPQCKTAKNVHVWPFMRWFSPNTGAQHSVYSRWQREKDPANPSAKMHKFCIMHMFIKIFHKILWYILYIWNSHV